MHHNSTSLFHEEQRITSNWIVLLVIPVTIISLLPILYGSFYQLAYGKAFGDNPSSDGVLILMDIFIFGIMGGVLWLLLSCKLTTDIERDGIQVKYVPFHRHARVYPWDAIERAEVRQYRPIMEYGGWGLRGFGKNRAFNTHGNMGLQLLFKDGKKLLIGTQKAEELQAVLASLGRG